MTVDAITIPIGTLWSLFRWVPKFILQRKFTPEVLADLIYVDLLPRHTPARIDLGECANFELWIQVINLSPFEVELDRAEFRLWLSPTLKATVLKRQKVKPGEIAIIQVRNNITDGEANQIARTVEDGTAGLDGDIDFNCAIHNFPKKVGYLEGVKPEITNAQFRRPST